MHRTLCRNSTSCTNYHGINLMSNTMKLLEREIKHRLGHETTISKNLFYFMLRRSTMEVIFLLAHLMKNIKTCKDFHMIIIDLEKTYDRISRVVKWWILEK